MNQRNKISDNTLFLLGAGFNRDAAGEVGPIECESIYIGKYHITPNYPLVADMWKICFPESSVDTSIPIEEKIQAAASQGNMGPVKLLCEEIAKCDHYLVPRLIHGKSCYRLFFDRFSNSHFLTFNYDALAEAFLLRSGVWNPSDGYGFPVEMSPYCTDGKNVELNPSQNLVIHLHGSSCLYESSVDWDTSGKIPYLQLKEKPVFKFDPNSIAQLFYPYQKASFTIGEDREIEQRVIAPVPDKSTGLKGAFVKEMYKKAVQLISQSRRLVCIGYDFNENDASSYQPLLEAVSDHINCRLIVVSPNANVIRNRLLKLKPNLECRLNVIESTFKNWVSRDCTH